ncbi:hypothetical protein OEA41_000114 [Lepraria neglecta]|uniref:NACHT domain-containing protein n=1 Tax=Lepraria neglecta TaxID=209136 RepID=A0AAD9ZIL4_9LECA|nr:hypothetical protein OEA41_000114 [Lepraria neglecta]
MAGHVNIYGNVAEPNSTQINNGDAGKGKTMLLCGIIEELRKPKDRTHLLSFFFCQATDSRINNATAVLRGLIYLLVQEQPSLISHVREKYDHAGRDLFEDVNAWVALSEIFTNILQDPGLADTYMIIDALDECEISQSQLLDLIVQQASALSRVKWIISSRNWAEIEKRMGKMGGRTRLCLELNAESVSMAVSNFIGYRVARLAQQKGYNDKTKAEVEQYLTCSANGTFLWVALVCQNLEEYEEWEGFEALEILPPGLDDLYGQMMQKIQSSKRGNLLKQILALVTAVRRPITLEEATSLDKTIKDIFNRSSLPEKIIWLCSPFLVLRGRTIYFVHQSAKDFLLKTLNNVTSSDRLADLHRSIFSKSLEIMSRTLHRDVYRLGAPVLSIDQVQQPPTDPLVAVGYSCVYWVEHLMEWFQSDSAKEGAILNKDGPLAIFFRQKFLYWLEALSLLGGMSEGVRSIVRLERVTKVRGHLLTPFALSQNKLTLVQEKVIPYLFDVLRDARRFLQSHKWVIENYPLQVYASALVFSPTRSLIRERFEQEKPRWIKFMPTIELQWSACLQTLEGHSDSVNSVVYSHDGKHLASASHDKTVKIWDASDGTCLQTLKGHSYSVSSVVFSYDSKHLASALCDGTVKIWDTINGTCLQTLEGHNEWDRSVVFSHDGKHLASASGDGTVKIWDTINGTCLQTLEGHNEWVNSTVYSHDGKHLASASSDNTVKIWDATDGTCLQTLEGHSDWVNSAVYSHDDKHLASASGDMTVKIWDASDGTCLQTLDVGKPLQNISFTKSGSFLHTEIGALRLETQSAPMLTQSIADCKEAHQHGFGLSIDQKWITRDSENLLWLPPDYRPSTSSVTASAVAIGCRHGRVFTFSLSDG